MNTQQIITVDSPGMGGSTPVPLDQRIEIWLEIVPALLKVLEVQHVSLMCHSAGTIYLLNTLYRCPEILDPKAPFVALIGR
jgi:pimeloyl-ACP methyl ester carboxylesterase